jgi:hypothetical protein
MTNDTNTPIKLDLTRHCIETEIRRCYNRAVSDYFKEKGARPELEPRIDMLQTALETWDFQGLRRRHPALAGRSGAEVALARGNDGALILAVDGEIVVPRNGDLATTAP